MIKYDYSLPLQSLWIAMAWMRHSFCLTSLNPNGLKSSASKNPNSLILNFGESINTSTWQCTARH